MEEFNKSVVYQFNKVLNDEESKALGLTLSKDKAILFHSLNPESVRIEYDSLQIGEEAIMGKITACGIPLQEQTKRQKGIFGRFFQNLAKTNSEVYGNKRLECCDLKHHQANNN